jgi:hypothetical protein
VALSPAEAEKRLEFLKAIGQAETPPPLTPAVIIRKHFAVKMRPVELPSTELEAPKTASTNSEMHATKPQPKATPLVRTSVAEVHPTATPALEAHLTKPLPKATPPAHASVAESHPEATPAVEVHVAKAPPKATPPPHIVITETHPTATPTPAVAVHTPEKRAAATPRPAAVATGPRAPALRITDIHATDKTQAAASRAAMAANRYPWKSGIVTTVFWIGEPAGGHNDTPNFSSSWDSNWTRAYGGYDNPNPEARRNFIPVKFVPRQNPFYVALPYNDVTRGTTKPEARVVIPWFKEAFRREGESVCRDRWVLIRNRGGRVVYAQWSDCGPFRTDHWQYVFGLEKPKPNLNGGAGLDVSPGVRDYLGLQSTDVTDWKFVDAKDVPHGPWSLYGDNNTFALK